MLYTVRAYDCDGNEIDATQWRADCMKNAVVQCAEANGSKFHLYAAWNEFGSVEATYNDGRVLVQVY